MLGEQILQTYLCEKKNGVGCAVCPDMIRDREIYFLLFHNDPEHGLMAVHRQCARAALERFILNKERKQREPAGAECPYCHSKSPTLGKAAGKPVVRPMPGGGGE